MPHKTAMAKDIVPEGFTLGLALVDAVPVIAFGCSFLLLGARLGSPLFIAGALLCLIGGAGKVLWKIIVVLQRKNVWPLFVQMRILMPVGFLLMIIALVVDAGPIDFAAGLAAVTSFPSCAFFALGAAGMAAMIVCAAKLDSSDVRANWVEQLINGAAQICIFVAILLA